MTVRIISLLINVSDLDRNRSQKSAYSQTRRIFVPASPCTSLVQVICQKDCSECIRGDREGEGDLCIELEGSLATREDDESKAMKYQRRVNEVLKVVRLISAMPEL